MGIKPKLNIYISIYFTSVATQSGQITMTDAFPQSSASANNGQSIAEKTGSMIYDCGQPLPGYPLLLYAPLEMYVDVANVVIQPPVYGVYELPSVGAIEAARGVALPKSR